MPSRKRIFSPIIFLHHHIETTILLRYKQNQFAKTFCANISISSGAFKAKDEIESDEIFKSVGIDKEGGLVFTLDTLQAYKNISSKQDRSFLHYGYVQASQITKTPLNSFDASLQVALHSCES